MARNAAKNPFVLTILFLPAALTACGHAAVSYSSSLPSTEANEGAIMSSAAGGNVSVVLPITRVVFQPPGSTTLNPDKHAANNGPPKKQKKKDPPTNSGGEAGNKSSTPSTSPVTTNIIGSDSKSYAFSLVQVEGPVSFQVKPVNDFFSSNQFGVTYLANSRIATSVSNTFTDETVSRIKSVASLVTTALSIAGAGALFGPGPVGGHSSGCTPKPLTIDLDPASYPVWSEQDSCYAVTIKVMNDESVAHQSNSVQTPYFQNFVLLDSSGISGRVWPVPACLTVLVTVTDRNVNPPGNVVISSGELKVIDPKFVEPLPVPDKGKIAMHPICGADTSDNPSDRWQEAFDSMSAIESAFPKPSKAKK